MKRILLLGSLPPPVGGVTIHIDRFFNLFKDNSKIELSVLDIPDRVTLGGIPAKIISQNNSSAYINRILND